MTCPDGRCATSAVLPQGPLDAERWAGVLKALGGPVRLRMVEMIAAVPELCVCEITPAFDLSSATVSHHLRVLREAGVVACERRGTFVYYWIQSGVLRGAAGLLETFRAAPLPLPGQ